MAADHTVLVWRVAVGHAAVLDEALHVVWNNSTLIMLAESM
jgi:hypothetical protein